jgi:hypothetical protein
MCDTGRSKHESTVVGTYRRTTEQHSHFGLGMMIVDQTVAQDEAAWALGANSTLQQHTSKPPPAK